MSRWIWFLSELTKKLGFRASLYGLAAVLTAMLSIYFGHMVPEDFSQKIGADAVDGILNILASSMLAITIFSVSTMVQAYSAATNNATPRASRLLMEDRISHNALSTFVGTFIFSIVGIIALQAGVYGASGRFVLYVVTIVIIAIIVITLLRWIHYLSRLGQVSEIITRVENAATESLDNRLKNPCMGGVPLRALDAIPAGGLIVYSKDIGYVQHVDMHTLSEKAQDKGMEIYIQAYPGQLVDPGIPLATIHGPSDKHIEKIVRESFILGHLRSFRQDPRYGILTLSEMASRALSPGINDPGTAIAVLSVGTRLLARWATWANKTKMDKEKPEILYPHIHATELDIMDIFDDFYSPIAHYGAGSLPVMIRMQKSFAALLRTDNTDLRQAVKRFAPQTLQRGLAALNVDSDKERLRTQAAV